MSNIRIDRKIVRTIYPDAACLKSQKSVHPNKMFFAIFLVEDGIPISNDWHRTPKDAWADAAKGINDRMIRKLII